MTNPIKTRFLLLFLFLSIQFFAYAQNLRQDNSIRRGKILETSNLGHMNKGKIKLLMKLLEKEVAKQFDLQYDVDVYKVVYETIDIKGNKTQASGMVAIPKNAKGDLPIMSFQHGTVLEKDFVPSHKKAGYEVGIVFGSEGYVTVLADYLGLGEGEGFHPYFHAQTEASACLDMLRAARNLCAGKGVSLNNQLFLVGYSQGSHATMALQREIETNYFSEFKVTASVALGTPFDLSESQFNQLMDEKPYVSPSCLPYILCAYNQIYKMYPNINDIFRSPYDKIFPTYFNEEMPYSHKKLDVVLKGKIPTDFIKAEIIKAVNENPDHPIRKALKNNDVYNWTPKAPIKICHCDADIHVSPASSVKAFEQFKANGLKEVELLNPKEGADHTECAIPSMLVARNWFATMKKLENLIPPPANTLKNNVIVDKNGANK